MRGLSAEEERGEEPRGPVDVNRVLGDALRLANLHRKQAVKVKLLLADGLPPVWGVPERLVQAMLNLLLNAAQAAEEASPPRVSVASELDGDAVVVRVSDNGPGIRYEDQDRIFDPFFTTKGPDRGTGLGLSIAFDIVREHGGVLEVRSRPGRGAAFVVRLPLAQTTSTP
jgi:signal transduction histidine kinase